MLPSGAFFLPPHCSGVSRVDNEQKLNKVRTTGNRSLANMVSMDPECKFCHFNQLRAAILLEPYLLTPEQV